MMRFLPIMLRTDRLAVLVVGGGRVAAQKLKTIVQSNAKITLCAPEIRNDVARAPVTLLRRAYGPDVLDGVSVVYACTSSRKVNAAVARDARARGLLVNVADDPESSSFVSPAVACREGIVVAVHSEALDPRQAVATRNAIADGWNDRRAHAR